MVGFDQLPEGDKETEFKAHSGRPETFHLFSIEVT